MKNYPKAIELFIEWFKNNEEFNEYEQEIIDRDFDVEFLEHDVFLHPNFFKKYIFFNRGSLFEFFDSQNILIDTVSLEKDKFFCTVYYKKNYYTAEYRTRFESLNEAFQIAFKLLEEKL